MEWRASSTSWPSTPRSTLIACGAFSPPLAWAWMIPALLPPIQSRPRTECLLRRFRVLLKPSTRKGPAGNLWRMRSAAWRLLLALCPEALRRLFPKTTSPPWDPRTPSILTIGWRPTRGKGGKTVRPLMRRRWIPFAPYLQGGTIFRPPTSSPGPWSHAPEWSRCHPAACRNRR